MVKIPDYIDCKNREIEVCDWYMCKSCPETCAYARDIKGIKETGIGAMVEEDVKRIDGERENIERRGNGL